MKFDDLENRRQFLRYLTAFTAGMIMPITMIGQNQIRQDRLGEILPTRKLGKTNVDVTMLGVGGYHIG